MVKDFSSSLDYSAMALVDSNNQVEYRSGVMNGLHENSSDDKVCLFSRFFHKIHSHILFVIVQREMFKIK